MSVDAVLIDFVCAHCRKAVDAATLSAVWYSAGKPCCCKTCKRAEDAKLAQPPEVVTVDDLDFELGGTA